MDALNQNKTHDMRLILIFCGLGFLYLFVVHSPNESNLTADPLACFSLDIHRGLLEDVRCNSDISTFDYNYPDPSSAIFYFEKISINQASSELLQTVPGIGPQLAGNIIEYRQLVGRFTGVESIKKLPGVGDKRARYLMTQLTCNE